MKGFAIAILTATPLLLAAAILWRGCSPPAAKPPLRSHAVAVTAETRTVEESPQRRDIALIRSESAMSDEQPMSLRDPADEPFSGESAPSSTRHATADALPAVKKAGVNKPIDPQLTPGERLTFDQTAPSDTSLRNADFPRTYISSIRVDLTSPNHWVRLTWSGPDADSQETGPFHSSPGRGLGNNDCDDVDESNRDGSNCTPKGTMQVQGFSESMPMYSHCRHVTWFQIARGIAFHYYPTVPNYPASHGCVRLDAHAAQLIHNNAKIGATEVVVDGKWEFVR
jgi:hypothetical protein